MTAEPKPVVQNPAIPRRDKPVRVFTYPKIIFIFPTFVASLICAIGMFVLGDPTADPSKVIAVVKPVAGKADPNLKIVSPATSDPETAPIKLSRFETAQNLLGVLFLSVFMMNLLVMAIDFPRFTIVALIFFGLFAIFLVLWVGAYFDVDLVRSVRRLLSIVYVEANSGFYFMISCSFFVMYTVILLTRYLDYWEILPNEILHHHGPLSDLERYPTTNLKFDKEIPDVIEHLFLGAGKIVLHLPTERKSIVLDNVLFINSIETSLKTLMSRMEVRLTSDREGEDA